jgi:alpha-N-arabinofuranosidase
MTLNILNRHCERVHMANLAQTINVLQALVLTEADQMLLTPTYHVFDLYQVHQDAILLETSVENETSYTFNGDQIPQINFSASKNDAGVVHLSLCNLDPNQSAQLEVNLPSVEAIRQVSGQILTADEMRAHNTFEQPERIKPAAFQSCAIDGQRLTLELAPMSVCVLALGI